MVAAVYARKSSDDSGKNEKARRSTTRQIDPRTLPEILIRSPALISVRTCARLTRIDAYSDAAGLTIRPLGEIPPAASG